MIAIVLLGLLACASAAPRHHYYHHHEPSHYQDDSNMDDYLDRYIESQMFDTRRFWSELSREMMRLDTMLADLGKRFPSNEPSVQVDDKEYKLTIHLQGFDEKDVIVKAKKGLLVVQAVRKVADEPERNYLNMRTLPDNVGENGSWTYENGELKIVFPITQAENETPTQTTAPDHSREEMENNDQNKDQNEDIDEIRGDEDYKKDVETNEIPRQESTVEATTYAVGLTDDVELLPMRRNYYETKF